MKQGSITVSLAWRNLTASPKRFLASLAGTAFAVTLMFLEMGFRQALMDSMVSVLRHIDGDVALIASSQYTVFVPQPFPRVRLDQARAFSAVVDACPLYIESRTMKWRRLNDGLPQRIRVIAFQPKDNLLSMPEVRQQVQLLEQPDTALADRLSKSDLFGLLEPGSASELAGRKLEIVGQFSLGTDFQIHGNLIVNEESFLKRAPNRHGASASDQRIDLGVLRVKPGTDVEQLCQLLQESLPADVMALSLAGLVKKEQRFWDTVMPIGIVFNIGVAMGFVVGLIVCYQVLYAEIADHLAEFATLKAMGYTQAWLLRVIVTEAIYLSALGYLAGLGISGLLFMVVGTMTGLPMRIDPIGSLIVYGLTALMCVTAACLAARKLAAADPAELFQ